jgi:hypothetical protein
MTAPLKMQCRGWQILSGRMSDLTAETPPYPRLPIGVVSR